MSTPPVFQLSVRTRVLFGAGSLGEIGSACAPLGRRALIVTDPGIVGAGHVGRAVALLEQSGVTCHVFDGAEENPTTLTVDRAVETAREFRPDLLVGLGGGSSLDTAKGANFLLAGGGAIRDYWGTGKGRGEFLPMVAVPTTGGTGSELQSFALISDAETHVKMACGDPRAACAVAILDPELTVTQPFSVTSVTGIDAISHAVETWVCRRRNPFSSIFSREAFRLLSRAFPVVVREPGNIAARGDMQLGAALAGLAIEHSMLGAAHSLANPVTARWGVVHGQAVGIALPHVVRFNGLEVERLYRQLLAETGWEVVDDRPAAASSMLAGLITGWLRAGRLATSLADCGVAEADLPAMAGEAVRQWTAGFNPRPVAEADLLALYRQAWLPSGAAALA